MVGVLAAKGGLGVSSLATNLAVSIQKLTRDNVVVADFTPGSGDIGLSLGFTANGAAQLLRKDAKMITAMDIQNHVLTHDSGIHDRGTPSMAPGLISSKPSRNNFPVWQSSLCLTSVRLCP